MKITTPEELDKLIKKATQDFKGIKVRKRRILNHESKENDTLINNHVVEVTHSVTLLS